MPFSGEGFVSRSCLPLPSSFPPSPSPPSLSSSTCPFHARPASIRISIQPCQLCQYSQNAPVSNCWGFSIQFRYPMGRSPYTMPCVYHIAAYAIARIHTIQTNWVKQPPNCRPPPILRRDQISIITHDPPVKSWRGGTRILTSLVPSVVFDPPRPMSHGAANPYT